MTQPTQATQAGAKGTNEHDVKIAEVKGTNANDVKIAEVGYNIESLRKDAMLKLEEYKADKDLEYKKLKLGIEAAKGTGYAAMALAGYIYNIKSRTEVQKYNIEFGNK